MNPQCRRHTFRSTALAVRLLHIKYTRGIRCVWVIYSPTCQSVRASEWVFVCVCVCLIYHIIDIFISPLFAHKTNLLIRSICSTFAHISRLFPILLVAFNWRTRADTQVALTHSQTFKYFVVWITPHNLMQIANWGICVVLVSALVLVALRLVNIFVPVVVVVVAVNFVSSQFDYNLAFVIFVLCTTICDCFCSFRFCFPFRFHVKFV